MAMRSRGRLFLFLALALVAGLWYLWPQLQHSVNLQNRSSRTITHLTITTDDESETFENITPGEVRHTKLHLGQTTHFVFKGEFADKTRLDKIVTFKNYDLSQNIVITVGAAGNIQVDVQPPKS
jgi:hypothetical protein